MRTSHASQQHLAQLAGKYQNYIPIGAITGATLGAGGSLYGNLTDKEEGEGPLRLLTEAINAAPFAGIAGGIAGGALRNRAMRRANAIDAIRNLRMNAPALKAKARLEAPSNIRTAIGATAAIPLLAGAGGLYGGGLSNINDTIGIPGFAPGIDPESPGSSNTANARLHM